MAQACVMVQRDLENASHQQCTLTPAPPSMAPDASFITSSIRKRKKEIPTADAVNDKRIKAGADTPLPKVQFSTLADCCSPPMHSPDHDQEKVAVCGQDSVLFSPAFHPVKDGIDPGDNTSTDASTGTSASLDQADSEQQMQLSQRRVNSQMQPSVCSPCLGVPPVSPGITVAAAAPPSTVEQVEDEDDDCLDFDPYVFIKRLPPLRECFPPRSSFLLPRLTRRSQRKKTLVLDLDETLVHSTLDGACNPDFTFPVRMGPICHMVAVRKRPHLHHFLNKVAQLFEVVVFTASQQVYAEQLLDVIDPGRKLIRHRVFRDSCVVWEGNYLKDLTVLGRDLAHTLIVDNSPQAFGFQLENGVPIESWYDDDEDTELIRLLPFLEKAATAEDVRPLITEHFQLHELVNAAPIPLELPV